MDTGQGDDRFARGQDIDEARCGIGPEVDAAGRDRRCRGVDRDFHVLDFLEALRVQEFLREIAEGEADGRKVDQADSLHLWRRFSREGQGIP